MIQPEIVPLTERLRQRGLHITIETAGTYFAPVACDLMSISPKLANSTPEGPWAERHNRLRWRPEALLDLMSRYDHQLKFVIAEPHDMQEVLHMIEELSAEPARVVLMPEGTDPEVLHQRGAWIAEICKEEGFRFSPRLHVDLWGQRRGV
jgi:7-carboxy-7-deazaguanine synthase